MRKTKTLLAVFGLIFVTMLSACGGDNSDQIEPVEDYTEIQETEPQEVESSTDVSNIDDELLAEIEDVLTNFDITYNNAQERLSNDIANLIRGSWITNDRNSSGNFHIVITQNDGNFTVSNDWDFDFDYIYIPQLLQHYERGWSPDPRRNAQQAIDNQSDSELERAIEDALTLIPWLETVTLDDLTEFAFEMYDSDTDSGIRLDMVLFTLQGGSAERLTDRVWFIHPNGDYLFDTDFHSLFDRN